MKYKQDSAAVNSSAISSAGITLLAILAVAFVLLLTSVLLQGNFTSILSNPLAWFSKLDHSIAFDIVSTSAELLAAVLSIAITVVAIIVELAANRYSHRITSLFVKEPINIGVLSFFVIATVYSIWIAITFDASVESARVLNAGLFGSLIMVTISLVILLPYFAFVMSFLSPVSVIGKIHKSAIRAIPTIKTKSIARAQSNFLNAIDELQDIARRSAQFSDRAVETASINALLNLIIEYQDYLEELGNETDSWFKIGKVVTKDPDFISLNQTSLNQIVTERLWVEVKIMRQYLDLVSDSNLTTRDTSYLIAINTKIIATASIKHRPNLELMQLCIRCFNSYLRATINNKDARTRYYIMNQFRMLAEELLKADEIDTTESIARYLQFYGLLGFKQGIPFLLEVAAEDTAQLVGRCIGKNEALLDKLLDLLLDLDQEVKAEYQEDSLFGVRRAQLKLAAKFMEHGEEARAIRICDDLKTEEPERKDQLLALLKSENKTEFWEFTDRGVNFSYIPPEHRRHLDFLATKFR